MLTVKPLEEGIKFFVHIPYTVTDDYPVDETNRKFMKAIERSLFQKGVNSVEHQIERL